VIKLLMSAEVAAPRAAVWQALTDPRLVLRWRTERLASLGEVTARPRVGHTTRWRCRVRDLPLLLVETFVEVVPGERLRTSVSLGLFRFEETFALATLASHPPRTRVTLRVVAAGELPVVGGALDRFDTRRLAAELSSGALAALRSFCERRADVPSPSLQAQRLRSDPQDGA
jgi:uncharacterized protein YndB with AHSA1/START domain